MVGADSTCLGLHQRYGEGWERHSAVQGSLQLRIAGHRQRELHAGRGAGIAPGQWDISRVSGGRDAERHRLMPAQSSSVQGEIK